MVAPRLAVLMAAFLPWLVMSQEEGPIDPYEEINHKSVHKHLRKLKPRFQEYLTFTNITWGTWDDDYIPEDCAYFAKRTGVAPKDMEVYNVTYADCPDPWFVCLHKDLEGHLGLIQSFGRLPIHMRSWVKHLIGFHASYRPWLIWRRQYATQSDGNIVLWGPVKEWLDIMLHQAGHSLDLNGAYGQPLSSSQSWYNATETDRRVPSEQAKLNRFESVAENTLMAVYFKALGVEEFIDTPPGETPDDPHDIHRPPPTPGHKGLSRQDSWRFKFLLHQQDVLNNLGRPDRKGPSIFAKGGECTRRVLPSTFVRLEAIERGTCRRPPPEAVLSPGIEPIKLRPAGSHGQYECAYDARW